MNRDKSHFAFLIALARQLAAALENDGDDDVAVALASLGTSLGVLLADGCDDPGEDDGVLPDGVDTDDAPGDDTPLGAALARIAELEQRRAAEAVDVPRRRVAGGTSTVSPGPQLARQRRQPPVLSVPQRAQKKARRGKK